MPRYEYRVIPGPGRGERTPVPRTTDERFALAIERLLNQMASDGWDFLRAETLTCEDRASPASEGGVRRDFLVFRRPRAAAGIGDLPSEPAAPATDLAGVARADARFGRDAEADNAPRPSSPGALAQRDIVFSSPDDASEMRRDNGVEDTGSIGPVPDILRARADRMRDPTD
ncbi:hypothetical protein KUH32_16110 [Thalassococcus sp. CAU 1522]|uniref:DUF4177 domain-containing protein n=1 Tax=Thalassococcus arenae TaxID=2851652 RepID=A0ABS6NCL0_9RHOB|nr:hypothetical protein [Thalassococcus arenae]MBV2361290.1 hypothetical protein [Thalassococcus arenae]